MLLDEVVNTFEDDELLYIGATNGFFFIGTPVEYEQIIDKITDRHRRAYKRAVSRKKSDLKALLRPTGKREEEDPKDYANRLRETANQIDLALDCYSRAKTMFDRFTPFRGRIVTNEYKKDLGGTAIIVAGPGSGKYWTKEEWENDHENYIGQSSDHADQGA